MIDLLVDPSILAVPDYPSPAEAEKFLARLVVWFRHARRTGLRLVIADKYLVGLSNDKSYPTFSRIQELCDLQSNSVVDALTVHSALRILLEQGSKVEDLLGIREVLLVEDDCHIDPPILFARLTPELARSFREVLAMIGLFTSISTKVIPNALLSDIDTHSVMIGAFLVLEAEGDHCSDVTMPVTVAVQCPIVHDPENAVASVGENFENVYEAVKEASNQFDEDLIFLVRAFDSAKESNYNNPGRVFGALKVLATVCQDYRNNKLSTSLRSAFESRLGTSCYASDISDTAKAKYRGDYEVTYEGNRVLLGPHIRFGRGGGQAPTILRIYFHIDEQKKIFVIGHVGRHLRDDSF